MYHCLEKTMVTVSHVGPYMGYIMIKRAIPSNNNPMMYTAEFHIASSYNNVNLYHNVVKAM